MNSRQRFQKRPQRRVRICKHCGTKAANYRAPGSGRMRADNAHDLCAGCFTALVATAIRAWREKRRRGRKGTTT